MKNCSYKKAYSRLSLHYFLYFAVLGTILPYLGLYLQSLKFSPVEIGQLLAIMLITKVVSPNIWGWLADRDGRSIFWVRLATALAAFSALGLLFFESYWPLFLTILAFSFFWHASLPQFESYTFGCLAEDKHRYGEIRLWGSVGFIVAVVAFGWQIESSGIGLMPIGLVTLLIVVWASSFLVKEAKHKHEEGVDERFFNLLKRPEVLSLLVVSFLVQLSHGVYYAFYSIQLSDLGYDKITIAFLWALGVLAEIAVFFWMSSLFKNYSVRLLILLSIGLTIVRWLMIGFLADSILWLFFAQLLHAASFGLFHAAAIYLMDQYFTGKHHGKGQALYAATGHGLGVAVGMFIAGYAWAVGGSELAYIISSVAVVFAFIVAWKWSK